MERFEHVADVLRRLADSLEAMDEVSYRDEVAVCPLPLVVGEQTVERMLTGRRRITIEVRNQVAWEAYAAEIVHRTGHAPGAR